VDRDNTAVLQHDSYYRDRSHLSPQERDKTNCDHLGALETTLLVSHLEALPGGHAVDVPLYDIKTHTRTKNALLVRSRPFIVVEGILILTDKELCDLMGLSVFVDTDADIRFIRRMDRDISERGRSRQFVVEQYLSTVKPMHDQFVETSKRCADIVVREGGYNRAAIGLLVARIEGILAELPA